jgi:hypothetical protein
MARGALLAGGQVTEEELQPKTLPGGIETGDLTEVGGEQAPAATPGDETQVDPSIPTPEDIARDERNARRLEGPVGGPPAGLPVPNVPPPPVTFNLGGAGGGEGASSFARPGSAAARPFRSAQFSTGRIGRGAAEGPQRFGAGSAIVGGGGAVPPVSFGGEGGGAAADPQNDDELARILATVAGRFQGGQG